VTPHLDKARHAADGRVLVVHVPLQDIPLRGLHAAQHHGAALVVAVRADAQVDLVWRLVGQKRLRDAHDRVLGPGLRTRHNQRAASAPRVPRRRGPSSRSTPWIRHRASPAPTLRRRKRPRTRAQRHAPPQTVPRERAEAHLDMSPPGPRERAQAPHGAAVQLRGCGDAAPHCSILRAECARIHAEKTDSRREAARRFARQRRVRGERRGA
jgi:hypothetical protein